MDKLLDLGTKTGTLLVFGGPYSNIHALEALKEMAERKGIAAENILCTGDVVGYCAYPDEAVQFVKKWGIHCIAGNVELNLKAGLEDCGCNFDSGTRCDLLSKQWYPYAQQRISADSLQYISELPAFIRFTYGGRRLAVVHGSVDDTSQFIFESTPWSVKQQVFGQLACDTILAGHCGLPFEHSANELQWLNAGVIGMPANDASTDTWYLMLTDSPYAYTYHKLPYDWSAAKKAMDDVGLVPAYATTLATGLWDNMDILPEAEAAQAGEVLRV